MSETSTETTEGTEVVEDITVEATEEAPEKDVEDVFPREVVEELRRENAKYRQRAKDADTLAQPPLPALPGRVSVFGLNAR